MAYEAKNFEHLLGIEGLSENLLKTHFTLYQGYIANTNKLLEKLLELTKTGDLATPEFAEMKRRFGWEWNGMRLHELYFENLAKNSSPLDKNSPFAKKAAENFGSLETWEKNFKATGAMRGVGWTIAYYEPSAKRLLNIWINEHDHGHLAGLKPILIMDVFEHAYMLDYGIKKADYIEAFIKIIDWKIVSRRFDSAISKK
ncbi:Fe-Mn family superoxide dismutase [Patescibacteria group bacterium]|nr:Fe-Mn family superoxide dismutase [Patescibacteria group bacterium]MBU4579774.1 Fe-Mn family superoxide dismutase [Patescibacteria group bacterium]